MVTKKNKTVVTLDFTNIKTFETIPEGQHVAKPIEAKIDNSKQSGSECIYWTFKIAEGKSKGRTLQYSTSLNPKALWVIRDLLLAIGVDCPEKILKIDLEEAIDEATNCYIDIIHTHKNGKVYSNIENIYSIADGDKEAEVDDYQEASEEEEEEELEDEAEETEEEESSSTDLTEEDIMECEEDELVALVEDYLLDVDLSELSTIKKKRAAVWAAFKDSLTNNEDSGRDEDDYSEDMINNLDAKGLQELNTKHKLKVDLNAIPLLRKKRRAILAAMKKAGLV